ncbi:hypothetical protein EVAR_7194_1 [Eumeta japonica]|uniref:Uncharacterized protein n=1 Tax=Eumeta variegata TaxID=151549 RepID=A0A4C1U7B1_EUMVA|nr:hypothetical protein EVAR_7194_1 [Eumeta japonica]
MKTEDFQKFGYSKKIESLYEKMPHRESHRPRPLHPAHPPRLPSRHATTRAGATPRAAAPLLRTHVSQRYENQDWFIPSPALQVGPEDLALTPDQIRETLNYFREYCKCLHSGTIKTAHSSLVLD